MDFPCALFIVTCHLTFLHSDSPAGNSTQALVSLIQESDTVHLHIIAIVHTVVPG